jgi:hypothetical protein
MKKIAILVTTLIALLFIVTSVWAEGTTIDYSGSLEIDGITQTINNDFFLGSSGLADIIPSLGSYTKWQNDLRLVPNDQVTLKLRISYLNDTVNKPENNDKFVLSRGYIDFTPNDFLSIRAGKQRLGWGTGYAWNPTDILDQPRDAFTNVDDPEGVMTIRTDLHLGPITTQLVVTPDSASQDWDGAGRALRFKASPGGVDLSLGAVQDGDQSASTIGDFAYSIAGVGLHGEARYRPDGNTRSDKKDIYDYLLGLDYNLPGGYYLALEYYHNDEAYKNIDELKQYIGTSYNLSDPTAQAEIMEYLTDLGNNGGVLQDHYFLHGTKQFGDNYNLDLMLVYAPEDRSLVVQPEFDYIWGQNTRLFVKALLATGDSGSEANVLPTKSIWKLGFKVNY